MPIVKIVEMAVQQIKVVASRLLNRRNARLKLLVVSECGGQCSGVRLSRNNGADTIEHLSVNRHRRNFSLILLGNRGGEPFRIVAIVERT